MEGKRCLKLAIGLPLAAVFLWLTLRRIETDDVGRALAGANLTYIIGALVVMAVGYSCRIERWRLMLTSANPNLRWRDCAGPLFASCAANNLLPFRAGDVMRTFAFSVKLGTTSGVVLATVFIERLLDLLVTLAILGVALTSLGVDAENLVGTSGVVIFGIAVAVLLVLLFPRVMAPVICLLANSASRLLPAVGNRVADEVGRSLSTLQQLAGVKRMLVLIVWSAGAWIAEGCVYWLTALSFPSLARPIVAWFALPLGAFATLVPSAPGYVGTFDYFIARAMSALGNEASVATVCALVIHAVIWLPPTLIGSCYLLLSKRSAIAH